MPFHDSRLRRSQAISRIDSPPIMTHPYTTFISMSPRWRLPLRPLRMSIDPHTDSALSRLRHYQRTVLNRRSRFSSDSTNVPERDTASDLARVLFNRPDEKDTLENTDGGTEDANSHTDTSKGDDSERTFVTGSSHSGAREVDRVQLAKFFEIDAPVGLRGRRRSPRATNVEQNASRMRNLAMNSEQHAKRMDISKRPRSKTHDLGEGDEFGDVDQVQGETGLADLSVQKMTTSGDELVLDRDVGKEFVRMHISRGDGALPWREGHPGKGPRVPNLSQGEFLVPLLQSFICDDRLSRGDGGLPWARSEVLMSEQVEADYQDEVAISERVTTGDNVGIPPDCASILDGLNDLQREAVLADPVTACLVLAGPGSGKTRVLTHRIAYLVRKHGVSPFRILAVTFTNKAAGEMRDRVSKLLGMSFSPDWADTGPRLSVGTFHSICARILRRHGSHIGVDTNFDICDASDSRQVVSRMLRNMKGGTQDSRTIAMTASAVSKLKNDREGAEDSVRNKWTEYYYNHMVEFRNAYDKELRSQNKLDFDDMLVETRRLLNEIPAVRRELQDKFEHVLVDEWQDTNHVQFDLVTLLSGKNQNLFVVGDADQSIYKFRGADSGNLDRFRTTFPKAKKVALELNYRSSAAIVGAAQAVIEGDRVRPDKKMTTLNSFGNKVVIRETHSDRREAEFVVSRMTHMLEEGAVKSYSEIAILYRTNAQSRLIEESCVKLGIPYRLLSGTKFYDRQEIRDLVAYLKILANPNDNDSFRRVVNVPPRGIGQRTMEELEKYSTERNVPYQDGLRMLTTAYRSGSREDCNVALKQNAMEKLCEFQDLLSKMKRAAALYCEDVDDQEPADDAEDSKVQKVVSSLLTDILRLTKYRDYLTKRDSSGNDNGPSEKTQERQANVNELISAASLHTSLTRYLESATLMERSTTESDGSSTKTQPKDSISLMTLHGGKGLEFEAVFIIGAEDSIIPISKEDRDINEERRLLYVGMTRAKEHLTVTWRSNKVTASRGEFKVRKTSGPSRFLNDIPDKFVTRVESSKSKLERLARQKSGESATSSMTTGKSGKGRAKRMATRSS